MGVEKGGDKGAAEVSDEGAEQGAEALLGQIAAEVDPDGSGIQPAADAVEKADVEADDGDVDAVAEGEEAGTPNGPAMPRARGGGPPSAWSGAPRRIARELLDRLDDVRDGI